MNFEHSPDTDPRSRKAEGVAVKARTGMSLRAETSLKRPAKVRLPKVARERVMVRRDAKRVYGETLVIAERLRMLREQKNLSQGDIEKTTGLLRCYISRVENGHTVPAIETLEKFARALDVPMYALFYDGEEPPKLPNLPKRRTADDVAWGSSGKDGRLLAQFRRCLSQVTERDRRTLLFMAQKMAQVRVKP